MGGHISSNEIFVYIIYTPMFLVNFLSIHSAVCLEPALSVGGWICVTPKIMSQCSVTFVSHEYVDNILVKAMVSEHLSSEEVLIYFTVRIIVALFLENRATPDLVYCTVSGGQGYIILNIL